MKKEKIVQISANKYGVYFLTDEGNLYYRSEMGNGLYKVDVESILQDSTKESQNMEDKEKKASQAVVNALIERFEDIEEETGADFTYAKRVILRWAKNTIFSIQKMEKIGIRN